MDKIRALIIDDSSVMRKIVERSLRQAGIDLDKVFEASNGAGALASLRENPVDLILCDINMPVMDGLEFVRQAATLESAKGVPIVMITTEGSENHVVQALTVNQTGTDSHPSLASVLAGNPTAVQNFFQNNSGTGFANSFNNDLVNLTDPTQGVITLDLAGNSAQQTALTKQINDLQDRLSAESASLTLQFDQVNATLESYPSLLLTVTSEIGALNGNYNTTPSTQSNTAPAVGNSAG